MEEIMGNYNSWSLMRDDGRTGERTVVITRTKTLGLYTSNPYLYVYTSSPI